VLKKEHPVTISELTSEAWSRIRDLYRIPIGATAVPLDGDGNRLSRISILGRSQHVLRLSWPGAVARQIVSELMVLEYLSQRTDLKVPSPIPNRYDRLLTTIYESDKPAPTQVAMFSFVSGEALSGIKPTSDMMFLIGQTLGQLDLSLKKADSVIDPSPSKSKPRRKFIDSSLSKLIEHQADYEFLHDNIPGKQLHPRILEIANRLRNHYRKLLKFLPHQVIHSDANLSNLVFDGTRIGILDFDNMGYGPRIYEPTAPLHSIYDLEVSDNLPLSSSLSRMAEVLLAGYRRYIQLSEIELHSFSLFQAIRLFGVLGWAVSQEVSPQKKRALEQSGTAKINQISDLLEAYESNLILGRFQKPKFWISMAAEVWQKLRCRTQSIIKASEKAYDHN